MTSAIRMMVVFGILLMARPCFAWGEVGHRVVGRIAAALLTEPAQQKVADILGVENTKFVVAAALGDAAEWPDAVARDKYPETNSWHFIDLGVKPNPVKDNPLWASPDTAFARIVKYFGTIKQGSADELEPGSDLEFLAHLVGDVHQPLHSATDKDRGGNCLFVRFITVDGPVSERTKFHGAWDRFILEDRLGTNDRLIAKQLLLDWKTQIPARLAAAKAAIATNAKAAVRAWIEESHATAVTKLYGTLLPAVPAFETASVDSDCHNAAPVFSGATWRIKKTPTTEAFKLMGEQLVNAGVRLAALLNAAAE